MKKARIDALKTANPENTLPVPVDLVTASGSGLDPHPRCRSVVSGSGTRGLQETVVKSLVEKYTQGRQFGFLGEPRVNVLNLNPVLDCLPETHP